MKIELFRVSAAVIMVKEYPQYPFKELPMSEQDKVSEQFINLLCGYLSSLDISGLGTTVESLMKTICTDPLSREIPITRKILDLCAEGSMILAFEDNVRH